MVNGVGTNQLQQQGILSPLPFIKQSPNFTIPQPMKLADPAGGTSRNQPLYVRVLASEVLILHEIPLVPLPGMRLFHSEAMV